MVLYEYWWSRVTRVFFRESMILLTLKVYYSTKLWHVFFRKQKHILLDAL